MQTKFLVMAQIITLYTRHLDSLFFDYLNYKISANTGQRNQCSLRHLDFPCTFRDKSQNRPSNVNKLRPGDVEIIASLGDSIIGATGGDADNLFHAREQFRGISFASGARESWRTITTLPNILKIFNPDLAGGSIIKTGTNDTKGNNLNLAWPGSNSVDLLEQAKTLVRVLNNPRDRKRWKVVTIWMGHNDVCTHPCNTSYTAFDASPQPYMRRLARALDVLRDNLPNTFVNLLPVLDITIATEMYDKHPICHIAHAWICPCLFGGKEYPYFNTFGGSPLSKKQFQNLLQGYMREMYNLLRSGRYERDDFTVVLQPAFTDLDLFYKRPRDPGQRPPVDYSYFAPDCLHPSQKLHALMARALWNNMLQPVGQKTTGWSRDPPLLCPTPASPYLATRRNSLSMDMESMMEDYGSYMETVRKFNIPCYM